MCDECYESVNEYGAKFRYKKGTKDVRHCLTEPTIQYSDGSFSWWKNGLVHREDGPAAYWDNTYRYFLEGKEYNEKNYWKEIKKYRKEKLEDL